MNCGEGEKGLQGGHVFVHKKTRRRSVGLVFMCVRAYHYISVLCYCPLWQLFTLPLHPRASHRDTVFWKEVHSFRQLDKGKQNERQTDISHINLSVSWVC